MKTENNNIDLFCNPELLPLKVQKILNKFSQKNNTYKNCEKLQKTLLKYGFTFSFGLDAIPFNY